MTLPFYAQTKRELKKLKEADEFSQTRSLVESGSFRFIALRAFPAKGPTIDLATHHAVAEVLDESAKADLPYFGTAHGGVGYSAESGGIVFEGPIEGMNLSVNEKKYRITLTFTVKSGRDNYKCIYTIMGKGSATLGISSSFREQISYDGRVSAIE